MVTIAAHERYHRAWGVIRPGLVTPGDQFLEYLAENFGIDSDFDIERRGLGDREVVALKKGKDLSERIIGNPDRAVRIILIGQAEEAAVEVRNLPATLFNERQALGIEFVPVQVQAVEEEGIEAVVQEGLACLLGRSKKRSQIAAVTLVRKPALLLNEVEEHQSVHQALRVKATRFAHRDAFDLRLDKLEDVAVLLEELLRHAADVERLNPVLQPSLGVSAAVVRE